MSRFLLFVTLLGMLGKIHAQDACLSDAGSSLESVPCSATETETGLVFTSATLSLPPRTPLERTEKRNTPDLCLSDAGSSLKLVLCSALETETSQLPIPTPKPLAPRTPEDPSVEGLEAITGEVTPAYPKQAEHPNPAPTTTSSTTPTTLQTIPTHSSPSLPSITPSPTVLNTYTSGSNTLPSPETTAPPSLEALEKFQEKYHLTTFWTCHTYDGWDTVCGWAEPLLPGGTEIAGARRVACPRGMGAAALAAVVAGGLFV